MLGSTAAGAVFGATTGAPFPGGWPIGLLIGAATGSMLSPVAALTLARLQEPRAALALISLLTQIAVVWCILRTGNPLITWAASVCLYVALILVAGRFLPRRTTPIDPNRCPACEYDTTGLRGRTCPECGGKLTLPAPAYPADE